MTERRRCRTCGGPLESPRMFRCASCLAAAFAKLKGTR